MTTTRKTSTGRKPSLGPVEIERLTVAYLDETNPKSLTALSVDFDVCPATARKYLRLVLGPLPRGRSSARRRPFEVSTTKALRKTSTDDLLGYGTVRLLRRRHLEGTGVVELSKRFGVHRDRISRLLKNG
jgi:hypothetical protein